MKSSILLCFLALCFVQCKTTNEPIANDVAISSAPGGMNKMTIGRVSVNLQPDITIEEIVKEYTKYELKSKSIMSKTENKWLCTFNTLKVTDKALIKELNANEYIIKAQLLSTKLGDKTMQTGRRVTTDDPTRD